MVLRSSLRLVALLALLTATATTGAEKLVTLELPAGDPARGRETFVEMGCPSCHQIASDEKLQHPVSPNRGPTLGVYQGRQSAARLAMSIYSPSHEITGTLHGPRRDKLSPMPDFTDAVTVRQFLDLIAYIQSLARDGSQGG